MHKNAVKPCNHSTFLQLVLVVEKLLLCNCVTVWLHSYTVTTFPRLEATAEKCYGYTVTQLHRAPHINII